MAKRGVGVQKKPDRRIGKSKMAIFTAFVSLLKETKTAESMEKFTISDIIERANIARPTFYKYFKTKNDVIVGIFDEWFVYARTMMPEVTESSRVSELTKPLLISFEKFQELLIPIYVKKLHPLALNEFSKIVTSMTKAVYKSLAMDCLDARKERYIYDVQAGMVFMLFSRWASEGMIMDHEEFGLMVEKFTMRSMGEIIGGKVEYFNNLEKKKNEISKLE